MAEELEILDLHKPYTIGRTIKNEYFLSVRPHYGPQMCTKVKPVYIPVSILQEGMTGVPDLPQMQNGWNPHTYDMV